MSGPALAERLWNNDNSLQVRVERTGESGRRPWRCHSPSWRVRGWLLERRTLVEGDRAGSAGEDAGACDTRAGSGPGSGPDRGGDAADAHCGRAAAGADIAADAHSDRAAAGADTAAEAAARSWPRPRLRALLPSRIQARSRRGRPSASRPRSPAASIRRLGVPPCRRLPWMSSSSCSAGTSTSSATSIPGTGSRWSSSGRRTRASGRCGAMGIDYVGAPAARPRDRGLPLHRARRQQRLL